MFTSNDVYGSSDPLSNAISKGAAFGSVVNAGKRAGAAHKKRKNKKKRVDDAVKSTQGLPDGMN